MNYFTTSGYLSRNVTMFGLNFTPIFYIIVRNLADSSSRHNPAPVN